MGARGVIPPQVMARYLEHVRWEAAGDPRLRMDRLFTGGHRVVVRAQRLALTAPVRFHEALDVETWVSRVGRSSLDMSHRVVRAGDGAEVARARVTAVHVGPDGRPAPVPEAMARAVTSGPEVEIAALEAAAPADAWRRPVVIRPSDIDVLQHVNQSNYLAFFEDARQLAAEAGALDAAAARPAQSLALDYEREARLHDPVEVVAWALGADAFGLELRRTRAAAGGEAVLCRARVEVAPSAR